MAVSENDIRRRVADMINTHYRKSGLTVRALAAEFDMPHTTLATYMSGDALPPVIKLYELSIRMDIKFTDFFPEEMIYD